MPIKKKPPFIKETENKFKERDIKLEKSELIFETIPLELKEQEKLKPQLKTFTLQIKKLEKKKIDLKEVILPGNKILERLSKEKLDETEIESEKEEADDILERLFNLQRSSFDWDYGKLAVIIAVSDDEDSKEMLEQIVARKYAYHGNFTFEQDLESKDTKYRKLEEIREVIPANKEIIEKIKTPKLIISSIVQKKRWSVLVKALKDIAELGKKCVILYPKENDIKVLIYRIKNIPNVELKVIKLPKWNENTCKLIGKLQGIDEKTLQKNLFEMKETWKELNTKELKFEGTVDEAYSLAWKMNEKIRKQIKDSDKISKDLNKWLPQAIGKYYFSHSESKNHFLTKKYVYWLLKMANPEKNILLEQPDASKKIPDIKFDDQNWEIETGYPSKEELEKNQEQSDAFVHLMKLNKYESEDKVNVILPNLYAYIFRKQIKNVKRNLGSNIKFYTINWSRSKLELFLK